MAIFNSYVFLPEGISWQSWGSTEILLWLWSFGRYLDHEHQAGSQICHFYAIFMVVFGRVLDQLASAGEIGSCQDGGRREDEARLLSKTAGLAAWIWGEKGRNRISHWVKFWHHSQVHPCQVICEWTFLQFGHGKSATLHSWPISNQTSSKKLDLSTFCLQIWVSFGIFIGIFLLAFIDATKEGHHRPQQAGVLPCGRWDSPLGSWAMVGDGVLGLQLFGNVVKFTMALWGNSTNLGLNWLNPGLFTVDVKGVAMESYQSFVKRKDIPPN